jgi:hypothetical protein
MKVKEAREANLIKSRMRIKTLQEPFKLKSLRGEADLNSLNNPIRVISTTKIIAMRQEIQKLIFLYYQYT